MSIRKIERIFNVLHHNLTMEHGSLNYDRITDGFINLAITLRDTETDETIWYHGEYGCFDLASLIIGAYWHFTEWHGGQYSNSYRALCALGQVYGPGMTHGPEPESPEQYVYELLNQLVEYQS